MATKRGKRLRTHGKYKAALTVPASGSVPSLDNALFATRWLQTPPRTAATADRWPTRTRAGGAGGRDDP
ncbi:hypothetical protein AB0I10_34620, partial [Streptomyces sp. NPDC050636]|uniref:hypothetical protein n=1 Tax=Streptomyces sp. NPDC050636 TaxID=3154510 RepID=UPI0034213B62